MKIKWIEQERFQSEDDFTRNPASKELSEKFNKFRERNSKGERVKEYICKYSKYKKGFNCPIKKKLVFSNEEVILYIVEGVMGIHDHAETEESHRKNTLFSKEQEDEMKDLLKIDVTRRNVKKRMLDLGFISENMNKRAFDNKVNNIRK